MRVHEIFESISGEVSGLHQGVVCTFIRLSGCNLKCSYCDTVETQSVNSGIHMQILDIMKEVYKFKNKVVCITGGEPLLQRDALLALCKLLSLNNFKIIIETNGTHNTKLLMSYAESIVIDYKFEYKSRMFEFNFYGLRDKDVIKFVCRSKNDLFTGIRIQKKLVNKHNCENIFAFSPVMNDDSEWNLKEFSELLIKENKNTCVLSLQLHKVIGAA